MMVIMIMMMMMMMMVMVMMMMTMLPLVMVMITKMMMMIMVVIIAIIIIMIKIMVIMIWRKAGRSPEGFGVVPQVTACALTVRWGPSGPGPRRRGKSFGSTPEGRSPRGRPVVPSRDLGSFLKLLHALLL